MKTGCQYFILCSLIVSLFLHHGDTNDEYDDEEAPPTHVPHILSQAIAKEVAIGEAVTFPCDVDDLGDSILIWKSEKNSRTEVLFAVPLEITRDHRFEIVNETSLHLSSVQPEDGGQYICQISTNPPVTLTHTLDVLGGADHVTDYTVSESEIGSTNFPDFPPIHSDLEPPSGDRATAIPGVPCSGKSEKWRDFGGDFCYIVEKEIEVTFMDAVYKCYAEGGSLASFHSEEEIKRILQYVRSETNTFYIGLWRPNNGNFEWVDKSPFNFRNWERHRNPYDNPYDSRRVVEIDTRTSKWQQVYFASSSFGYICSSPKDQPPRESSKVCPDNSPKWRDLGGENCYIVESENATTWHDALRICSEQGGSLASFHSVEEVSVLVQHTNIFHLTLHIGLKRNAFGNFQWADKSPFDLEFGYEEKPRDVGATCGQMFPKSGLWEDIMCHTVQGYVCSTPKVYPGTSSSEQLPGGVTSPKACGGDIISENGTFYSPNYNENYGPNENCLWKITVPEDHQIVLHFRKIEVEYGSDCEFDYIEMLDGHETGSPTLRKLCGSQAPQTVLSSGNKMSVKFVSDRSKEDTGFIADFKQVARCGGDIVSEQGIIQTRNYPLNYPPNDLCIWKIRVPDGNKIDLNFLSFETEENDGCTYDLVQVLDGHDSSSPVLGRFCGFRATGSHIISSGHKITVKFTSDFMNEYRGFSAGFSIANVTSLPTVETSTEGGSWESTCGGDIVADRAVITSPNFPNDYPPYTTCTWTITVPFDYQVVLKFKAFNLEIQSECNYDFVEVRDGHGFSGEVLDKYCGHYTPPPVVSSGNKMTVKFTTDSSSQYSGFAASFSKGHGYSIMGTEKLEEEEEQFLCGENIIADGGVIQSPNYPENYGPNERCAWKITVPEGHKIHLTFLSFNVEIHDLCSYDYVEVREGRSSTGRLLAKLCGYDLPQEIVSGRNELFVFFNSDSSSEYKGFSAEFKKERLPILSTDNTTFGACGGVIDSDSGSVYSPNYPQNYPAFTECSWKITVPEGDQVLLAFQNFELEHSNSCNFDFVKVFDGLEEYNRLLGTFCGQNNPGIIRSSNNTMLVKFVADDSFENSGFFANFTKAEVCEENIFAENGIIQTRGFPNKYEPGEYCIWHITVPENDRVALRFLTFDVPYSDNCEEGEVKIYDGYYTPTTDTRPSRREYCGSDYPQTIRSTENRMTVIFTSGASAEQGQGFSAEFERYICGGDMFGESGTISSPNYPESYEANEFCTWNITVPENNEVVLHFESFRLESSETCSYDYVEVYDGHGPDSAKLGTFCGQPVPQDLRSSTEKMAVRFRSDSSEQFRGFRATFKMDVCGGDISSEGGVISSPNYPENYLRNKVCVWNITVSEGHQVGLQFQSFQLESSDGCQNDYVEVLDGHDPTSSQLGRFCGSNIPEQLISSTEKMSIKFVSDGSDQLSGFFAEFTEEIPAEEQILSLLQELSSVFSKQKERIPKAKRPSKSDKEKVKEILRSLRK